MAARDGKVSAGELDALERHATEAAAKAYAPYSNFPVGAAVLTAEGEVFSGCNVENASYGLTICAERNAVFQAVAAGHRSIRAVVVVSRADVPSLPCGACRQVLNEFGPKAQVRSATSKNAKIDTTLDLLLPSAFGPQNLEMRHGQVPHGKKNVRPRP